MEPAYLDIIESILDSCIDPDKHYVILHRTDYNDIINPIFIPEAEKELMLIIEASSLPVSKAISYFTKTFHWDDVEFTNKYSFDAILEVAEEFGFNGVIHIENFNIKDIKGKFIGRRFSFE